MKEQLRDKGLWVALFAFLGMILADLMPNFNENRYEDYVDMFLYILIAGGVIVDKKVTKLFKSKRKNDGGTK
jgi:hypothetical protein